MQGYFQVLAKKREKKGGLNLRSEITIVFFLFFLPQFSTEVPAFGCVVGLKLKFTHHLLPYPPL